MRIIRFFSWCICFGSMMPAYAWHWHDLWQTSDYQAQQMMINKQYKEAQQTFKRSDWRAAAAFRARDFKQAAQLYSGLHQADDYYNTGNALAQMGEYQQAIQAYNKALALDKANPDAAYNRAIVEKLLKKQQHSKPQNPPHPQENKDKQNQTNQEQGNESSNNQNQNNTDPSNNDQNQPNQAKNPPEKQDNSQSTQDSQNPQPQTSQPKTSADQQTSDKETPAGNTKTDPEQQQAKEQWLNMIPDDPGGLLRQKFLRDYLRRRGEL